jgi:hypothetical protein
VGWAPLAIQLTTWPITRAPNSAPYTLTLFIRLNSVLVIWLFLDVGEKFFRDWYALKEDPTEVDESTPFRHSLCRQQQPNRLCNFSGSLY